MKEVIWLLDDWEFYPDKSSLLNKKDAKQVELNDTLNNILILLIESKGNVLSRDLIAEKGWKNRIVTDDSIRQAIKKLRETLDLEGIDSESSCIKTVRGKGYRFLIEPKEITQSQVPTQDKPHNRKKLKLILTGLIFFAVITSYAGLKGMNVDSVKAGNKKILTFEKGGEFGFSMSQNGNYSYGVSNPETNMSQKILIRDSDNNLVKEINRSSDKGYITQPVFSPSGNKLLFLDFDPDNCKISYYDANKDEVINAIKCSKTDGLVALDWFSEDEILFSTSKSLKFALGMVRYNLITKEYHTISKLPIGGRGDFLARSCNSSVASVRDRNWKEHDIYIVKKNGERKLEGIIGNPYSLDWTDDCKNLFYTTSSGGVYYYDIENANSIKVKIDSVKNSIIKYKDNSIYLSGDRMNDTDISTLDIHTGEKKELFKSTGKLSKLIKAKNESVFLFFSDRTGINQIWQADLDMKNIKQLTFLEEDDRLNHFQYDELTKKLYYSVGGKVFESGIKGTKHLVYDNKSEIRKFHISGDKFFYIEYSHNHWQLIESSLSDLKQKIVTRGISNIKTDAMGSIYVADNEFGIYLYEDSQNIKSILAFQEELSRWTLDKDGNIYLYGPNDIYIYNKDSELEHLFTIKKSMFANLYVSDGVLYIPNNNSNDMKITKYDLSYTY